MLVEREPLVHRQREGPSLKHAMKLTVTVQEAEEVPKCYFLHDEVPFRKSRRPSRPADANWTTVGQLLLPQCYRKEGLALAHESVHVAHLGAKKTLVTFSGQVYMTKNFQRKWGQVQQNSPNTLLWNIPHVNK